MEILDFKKALNTDRHPYTVQHTELICHFFSKLLLSNKLLTIWFKKKHGFFKNTYHYNPGVTQGTNPWSSVI